MNTQLDIVKKFLLACQAEYCAKLSEVDGGEQFIIDTWQHAAGGGGITRVLRGQVFEQAGVNFSHVFGESLPPAATNNRPQLIGKCFNATGVSVVIHPRNPYVPTAHANFRFFSAGSGEDQVFWFGGGFDLTPYYPFEEDCRYWHEQAQAACEPFGEQVYPQYKAWCDEYFYLKHRAEQRGVGGLFFDDLHEWGFEKSFAFLQKTAQTFLGSYITLANRRCNTPYSERERNFQLYRRGRYVEFNLLYDRGTLFGLQSGGRTESILMSLPPVVNWAYNLPTEPGSDAARLAEFLRPRDWINACA